MTITETTPGRPYWLTEPCPDWCTDQQDHRDEDLPGDRVHFGEEYQVLMTLEPPEVGEPVEPEYLQLYLTRHVEQREATITLSRSGWAGVKMRLDEAEVLAERLAALVREALQG